MTPFIVEEWRQTIANMEAEGVRFRRSPWATLEGLIGLSHAVIPAPLGKQRCRDASDDPYLACALAARAEFIVSRDPDLLALGKPFGVEVLTPRATATGSVPAIGQSPRLLERVDEARGTGRVLHLGRHLGRGSGTAG